MDPELAGHGFWIINPDILAARICSLERLRFAAANLQAVTRIEAWLRACVDAYQSVGVETVLSTGKYRSLVEAARLRGFEVRLTYVILDDPERNVERVRTRVLKGGHNVPRDKIVARYWRSLDQLPWFLDQADRVWVYDNSGDTPRLIASKDAKLFWVAVDALPPIRAAIAQGSGPS